MADRKASFLWSSPVIIMAMMAFRELELAGSEVVMTLLSCRLPPHCDISPHLIKASPFSKAISDNTKIELDSGCFLRHPVFSTRCSHATERGDLLTETQCKTHFKIPCFHKNLFKSVNFKPKGDINYWTLSGYG